jgi:hypothetical protein
LKGDKKKTQVSMIEGSGYYQFPKIKRAALIKLHVIDLEFAFKPSTAWIKG